MPGTSVVVSLRRCKSYRIEQLTEVLCRAIDDVGGLSGYVRAGQRVLLKPNLICAAPVDRPAQTHPHMVAAVARLVQSLGATAVVGDSPAFGSVRGNAAKIGLDRLCDEMGVELIEFNRPRTAPNATGRVYEKFVLDAAVLEADVIINLPKLKAHRQVYLTSGIKNMFGCMPGKRKAWWHLKAGAYEDYFARMIAEVYALTAPALTVVDAIEAMEGNGPGRGEPKHIGAVLAGTDAVAIERVCCDLVGCDPMRVPILQAAADLEVGCADPARINVTGDSVDELRVDDFVFPSQLPIGFSLPRVVKSTLRQAWIVRRQRHEMEQGQRHRKRA